MLKGIYTVNLKFFFYKRSILKLACQKFLYIIYAANITDVVKLVIILTVNYGNSVTQSCRQWVWVAYYLRDQYIQAYIRHSIYKTGFE